LFFSIATLSSERFSSAVDNWPPQVLFPAEMKIAVAQRLRRRQLDCEGNEQLRAECCASSKQLEYLKKGEASIAEGTLL
jgi:hypothetical protein